MEGENCNNYAENIKCHRTKFSRLGDGASEICPASYIFIFPIAMSTSQALVQVVVAQVYVFPFA
jgi:hypothetical protein